MKKFVNAAGFVLDHVNEEFTFYYFINAFIAYRGASCGAAATNVFHPIRLSTLTSDG